MKVSSTEAVLSRLHLCVFLYTAMLPNVESLPAECRMLAYRRLHRRIAREKLWRDVPAIVQVCDELLLLGSQGQHGLQQVPTFRHEFFAPRGDISRRRFQRGAECRQELVLYLDGVYLHIVGGDFPPIPSVRRAVHDEREAQLDPVEVLSPEQFARIEEVAARRAREQGGELRRDRLG